MLVKGPKHVPLPHHVKGVIASSVQVLQAQHLVVSLCWKWCKGDSLDTQLADGRFFTLPVDQFWGLRMNCCRVHVLFELSPLKGCPFVKAFEQVILMKQAEICCMLCLGKYH